MVGTDIPYHAESSNIIVGRFQGRGDLGKQNQRYAESVVSPELLGGTFGNNFASNTMLGLNVAYIVHRPKHNECIEVA